jgi:hypothetical protein
MKNTRLVGRVLGALFGLFILAGCDDDDISRNLQPGQGAIFINNNTSSDLVVFIDGERFQTVQDFSNRAYDLDPGIYRVVLDESGGDRAFRDDVDVIEGRLTVLDVAIEPFGNNFDVEVFFRRP